MAPPMASSSPPRINELEIDASARAYEQSLKSLTIPQLHSLLAQINGQLQAQATASVTALLTERLAQESQPLERSTRMPTRSSPPMDRGQAPSPSRPPSPLELLVSGNRIGPRLAGRLVLSSARAVARSREE